MTTWILIIITSFGGLASGMDVDYIPGFESELACSHAKLSIREELAGKKKPIMLCVPTAHQDS